MTLAEAKRVVDEAIDAAFPRQDDRRTNYVSVRIDANPSDPTAFEAFILAPDAGSHLRARMATVAALAGERVTFPRDGF